MAKIRDDFDGITIVRVGLQDLVLRAGDTVPDGATVGAHLAGAPLTREPTKTSPAAVKIPPKAGAGSSTEAWRAYASEAVKAAGLSIDIPADAKRDDIIEALEEAQIPTE